MVTKKQLYVMVATTGVSVANIYYNQPILNTIANDLGVSDLAVGNLPTFAQAGYGLGLFSITPLGDKMDKKKILIILHLLLGFTLIGLSFINNIFILYALSLLLGLFAVSPQIIIPMGAMMGGKDRGKIVGTIFSGLLTGVLLSRTLSGYITTLSGSWHTIFAISAVLVLANIYMIVKTLPSTKPNFSSHYFSLLKSSVLQLKRFSMLRRNVLLIATSFGLFTSFWTTLTFKLSSSPFNFGNDTIGLFGFLGVGGAMLAPYIGKKTDMSNPFFLKIFAIFLMIVGIILIRYFDNSLYSFIIAVLLLDIGFQVIQVSNTTQIYQLDESAYSRINTIYMSCMFLGGAVGTFIGVYCFERGGWNYVTIQMLTLALISSAVIIYSYICKNNKEQEVIS